jgi:uncharacterized protein YqgC (DUF456 family)
VILDGLAGAVAAIDLVTVVAFVLLIAGVVGAVLPGAPAALFSLAGVFLYWWGSGFADPGTLVLVTLTLIGLLAIAADWFGGVVAARVGGASTTTTFAAGAVSLVLLFVAGPIGVLLGSAGTVFALEYRKHQNPSRGARAAGAFVLGFFASAVAQLLLTFSMLLAMLGVVAVG